MRKAKPDDPTGESIPGQGPELGKPTGPVRRADLGGDLTGEGRVFAKFFADITTGQTKESPPLKKLALTAVDGTKSEDELVRILLHNLRESGIPVDLTPEEEQRYSTPSAQDMTGRREARDKQPRPSPLKQQRPEPPPFDRKFLRGRLAELSDEQLKELYNVLM